MLQCDYQPARVSRNPNFMSILSVELSVGTTANGRDYHRRSSSQVIIFHFLKFSETWKGQGRYFMNNGHVALCL